MELIDKKKAKEVTFIDTGYYDPINVATAIRDMIDALPTTEAIPITYLERRCISIDGIFGSEITQTAFVRRLIKEWREDEQGRGN